MSEVTDTTANVERQQNDARLDLVQKREVIISELTAYHRHTYSQLGAHSREEADGYLRMLQKWQSLPSEEDLAQHQPELEHHWRIAHDVLPGQLEKIDQAWGKLNEMLNDATTHKTPRAISDKSKKRWIKRWKDANTGYNAKLEYVNFTLPLLLSRAEKLAKKREKMMREKKLALKQVNANMVADIAIFKDEAAFLDLHYSDRENLAFEVDAAIAGAEQFPVLYKKAQGVLDAAVASGVMSKRKVGKWLDSLFNQGRTPEEIDGIIEGNLKDYIGVWTKLRYRFDRIERQMEGSGVPQGFTRLSEKKFLDLDFFQRESYVDEAERALRLDRDGPSDKPIDQLKLQIRHALQTKDWDYAESLINQGFSIAEGEDVYELNSMQSYLRQFRKNDQEQSAPMESAQETLDWMREVLMEVPSSVRLLYIEALKKGPQVTRSFFWQFYNLVWCHDHGYLDEGKEEELLEKSYDDTQQIIENGHEDWGLENINFNAASEDDQPAAARPYKQTWAPTLYHLDCCDGSARGAYLESLRGSNYARDYWCTLKIHNLRYEKHDYLVKKVNWKLRSGLYKLDKMGVAFTESGPPVFTGASLGIRN